MRWSNVIWRWSGTLSEEELLHLLHDHFLILLARRVQPILVEKHLAILRPLSPGLLRDLVIDFLTQFGIEWRLRQSGQLLFQLCAENFVFRHDFRCPQKNYRTCGGDAGPSTQSSNPLTHVRFSLTNH